MIDVNVFADEEVGEVDQHVLQCLRRQTAVDKEVLGEVGQHVLIRARGTCAIITPCRLVEQNNQDSVSIVEAPAPLRTTHHRRMAPHVAVASGFCAVGRDGNAEGTVPAQGKRFEAARPRIVLATRQRL